MASILGDLEQKVINVLWNSEKPLKPSEVLEQLDGKYAYTTIMTVLSRMSAKGILKRKKVGKAYAYCSVKDKEQFAKNKLGNFYDEVLGNYGNLAISQFVDTVKDDPENIKALQEYLAQQS